MPVPGSLVPDPCSTETIPADIDYIPAHLPEPRPAASFRTICKEHQRDLDHQRDLCDKARRAAEAAPDNGHRTSDNRDPYIPPTGPEPPNDLDYLRELCDKVRRDAAAARAAHQSQQEADRAAADELSPTSIMCLSS